MTDAIESWIAEQSSNSNDKILMFYKFADPPQPRVLVENAVRKRCIFLTKGQRCADWFILQQFKVTGTIAEKILLSHDLVLNTMFDQVQ